jgi:hypothetical protein
VGVSGPIRSVAWDPLYEQSIRIDFATEGAVGHYLTCNIAYRRSVLEVLGGFRADLFAHAHAEDRDLAARAKELGDIGYAPGMAVSHEPRRIALKDVVRQARWARDDLVLYALNPQLTTGYTLPLRLEMISTAGRRWLRNARHDNSSPSVKRLLRATTLATVAMAVTAWTVLCTPPLRVLRSRHSSRARSRTG